MASSPNLPPAAGPSRGWLAALATALAAALLAVAGTQLWTLSLSVPFGYAAGGDVLYQAMRAKSVLRHGSYWRNPDLGMPTGAELYDFPDLGNVHLGLIRLLGLVTADPAVALNLAYLLTFPLTALVALWAFRRLGVATPLAIAGGLLYAFLPGHFIRGVAHLGIGTYLMIPAAVVVCLWIASGEPLAPAAGGRARFLRGRAGAVVAVIFFLAAGKVYHSFFAGFFLAVAGALGALKTRSLRPLLRAATAIALLVAALALHLSPNLIYFARHGKTDLADRAPGEAEVYGLKVAQLLLPAKLHRLFPLARLRAEYDEQIPPLLLNENQASTLGAAASAGFLLLLLTVFGVRLPSRDPEELETLGRLNLAGLLLATVGGFGSLFAIYVWPQIRAYNRISFFLAFFALAALLAVVERLARELAARRPGSRLARRGVVLAALGLAAGGLWDQMPSDLTVPQRENDRLEAANDAAFVAALEDRLADGASVFQVPYTPFPEREVGEGRALVYDALRLYLHARTLRWSSGAIYGRETDRWQRRLTREPPEGWPKPLREAGFAGLCVDTHGYEDDGGRVLRRLRRVLGPEALTSADGRWVYFSLAPATELVAGEDGDGGA